MQKPNCKLEPALARKHLNHIDSSFKTMRFELPGNDGVLHIAQEVLRPHNLRVAYSTIFHIKDNILGPWKSAMTEKKLNRTAPNFTRNVLAQNWNQKKANY
jgi:hypothetical protein